MRPRVDTSRYDERVESTVARTHVFTDDSRVSRRAYIDEPSERAEHPCRARISLLCEDRIFIHEGWSRSRGDFGDGDVTEIDGTFSDSSCLLHIRVYPIRINPCASLRINFWIFSSGRD